MSDDVFTDMLEDEPIEPLNIRQARALQYVLSCLKHHHLQRKGISALVQKAESILEGEE